MPNELSSLKSYSIIDTTPNYRRSSEYFDGGPSVSEKSPYSLLQQSLPILATRLSMGNIKDRQTYQTVEIPERYSSNYFEAAKNKS
jgi:hypothetical protein